MKFESHKFRVNNKVDQYKRFKSIIPFLEQRRVDTPLVCSLPTPIHFLISVFTHCFFSPGENNPYLKLDVASMELYHLYNYY